MGVLLEGSAPAGPWGGPLEALTDPFRAARQPQAWAGRLALAQAADPDPLRNRLRAALTRLDLRGFRATVESAEAADLPAETLFIASEVLFHAGDRSGAIALLRRAQPRHPGDFWINLQLTLLLSRSDQPDQAVRYAAAAVAARPGSPVALFWLGRNLYLQPSGDRTAALNAFRAAARNRPGYGPAVSGQAWVLEDRGDLEEAEAAYHEAARLMPDEAAAQGRLGLFLLRLGRPGEALPHYRAATRAAPKDPTGPCGAGWCLQALGRWDEAATAYREAVRVRPDAYHTGLLGHALERAGRLDDAIEAYRKAPPGGPGGQGFCGSPLANALERKSYGDRPEVAELRQAANSRPDDFAALVAYADACRAGPLVHEAVDAYRAAVRLRPADPDANYRLGLVLLRRGDAEEAAAFCRTAAGLRPADGQFQFEAGRTQSDAGEPVWAVDALRRAVRLGPREPRAWYFLGRALADLGIEDGAAAAFLQAVGLNPRLAEGYRDLAESFRRRGQLGEALAVVRREQQLGLKTAVQVRDAERRAEELAVSGRQPPAGGRGAVTTAELSRQVELAWLCALRGLHAPAARTFATAGAASPNLLSHPRRYREYAILSATLAAAGRGGDGPPATEADRQTFARLGRAWLREEFWSHLRGLYVVDEQERIRARRNLRRWQHGPAWAPLRDEATLAGLPAEDREAWRRFWADLDRALESSPVADAPAGVGTGTRGADRPTP